MASGVDKGLSTGEKRMYAKAHDILVSELSLALGVGDEEVKERIENVLREESESFNTNLPQKEQKSGKTTGIVLLAAGRGTRLRRSAGFAVDMPKAFISLGNQTILQHSVKSLEGLVGELVLVVVCPWGPDGDIWRRCARLQVEDLGVLQSHFRRRLKEIVYICGEGAGQNLFYWDFARLCHLRWMWWLCMIPPGHLRLRGLGQMRKRW